MNSNVLAAEAALAHRALEVNPRWRLAYHIMAPAGWLNDPNGVSWFADEYHVFYQHHPYSSEWGPMHWGHVTSTDLVHWRDAGIALAPGDPCDRDGCFSGCAVDNDGEFTLVYTGHHYVDPNPRTRDPREFTQNQNIAVSKDGIHFEKYPGNPVIPAPPEDSTHHFRDPKVWRRGNSWFMILGNSNREGRARVLLYRSADLREWQYLGPIAEADESMGYMWECPDLFELDGRHVLLVSPMGMQASGDDNLNRYQTGSLIGSFDYTSHRLEHGSFTEMDRGHDFYAIQTMQAPDGRRVGIGWMHMWASEMPEQQDGWAGALTLPRELHVTTDGRLTMQPVAEVQDLRVAEVVSTTLLIDGEHDTKLEASACEILLDADLAGSDAHRVGLQLRSGTQVVLTVAWDRGQAKLELDRGGDDGLRQAPFQPGDRLKLRVFVDRSSVEVFTEAGLVTMTSRYYPQAVPTLHLLSEGGPTEADLQVFALADIWKPPTDATTSPSRASFEP